MQYTTMVLELLQQHPRMYAQLCLRRMLTATMERYADELKASHAAWTERLSQAKPESDASPIASEGLELALEQLQACLRQESSTDDTDALSLADAMAFLRRPMPSA
jgi:hypothetical protein